jgi:hypothetical protein
MTGVLRAYFLFREAVGSRLGPDWSESFLDVNTLCTDIRHHVDHGDVGKSQGKSTKIGKIFEKYSGEKTPETLDPSKFPLVQSNILGALEGDLRILLSKP